MSCPRGSPLGELGIHFRDLEAFGCCGFPVKSLDVRQTTLIAARNLALAEKEGVEICALCNACVGTLTETAHVLDTNPELKAEVNERLKEVGLRYNGPVKVRHYMRLLWEEVGLEAIKSRGHPASYRRYSCTPLWVPLSETVRVDSRFRFSGGFPGRSLT